MSEQLPPLTPEEASIESSRDVSNYREKYDAKERAVIRGAVAFHARTGVNKEADRIREMAESPRLYNLKDHDKNRLTAIAEGLDEVGDKHYKDYSDNLETELKAEAAENHAVKRAKRFSDANLDVYIEAARQEADEALAPRGDKINLVPAPGEQSVSVGPERVGQPQ